MAKKCGLSAEIGVHTPGGLHQERGRAGGMRADLRPHSTSEQDIPTHREWSVREWDMYYLKILLDHFTHR